MQHELTQRINRAIAAIAAGIGQLKEILINEYACTVRADGFVCRQLVVQRVADEIWVGTKCLDSRIAKPYGENTLGRFFSPDEVDEAISYGKAELSRVLALSGKKDDVPAQGLIDRLFIGVYPGGIVYADRYHEKASDYAQLAFLAYDTLELKVEPDCPPDLRELIEADAAGIQAKRGHPYSISDSGQTVTLGSAIK